MSQSDFEAVFVHLKAILVPFASRFTVTADTDELYSLDTKHLFKNGKPIFFGAVRRGKAYVSFHLMPVYAQPDLQDGITPGLKKHMQGKSCFNFRAIDEQLFKELAKLTKTGIDRYKAAKYV